MADFSEVANLRGPRLADLPQYVSDVLAIHLLPQDEFQAGKVELESYDFVSYALTGMSAAMQNPDRAPRATTTVTIPIADDKAGTGSAQQNVTLYGPGDVLAIDHGQIVRRYPAPGSTNAEETFHAHIEFDRPEVPWAFSATAATEGMQPWITLVVLTRDEVEWEPARAGLQPVLLVDTAALPDLADAAAWAHAQATSGPAALTARLSTAHAPINVSRLVGSRVLTQDTNYVACVVPTTGAGRNAGLGVPGGGLEPAWTRGTGLVQLPVYDRWEFRTAPDGDFKQLAVRLEGIAAPWRVGRRIMDTSQPGEPLTPLAPEEPGRRQVIRCALYSVSPKPPEEPSDTDGWAPDRIAELKDAVEAPGRVEGTAGFDPGAPPDLPILGPRLYARAQMATSVAAGDNWFSQLNLTPVHRVVGGLGTRVVVKDQEPLMQAAWAQVGEVEEANRQLRLAELARLLAQSVHLRVKKLDTGRLLQFTRPAAARVKLDGRTLTLGGETVRSATPPAALGGAVRRVARPTGPVARRLATTERTKVAGIVATDAGFRDFTMPAIALDGISGLSEAAIASLRPESLAAAFKITPEEAVQRVRTANETVLQGRSLATAISTPAAWGPVDTAFRPGAVVTDRVISKITERLPADPESEPVVARALGGLAAGIAVSRVDHTASMHQVALNLGSAIFQAPPIVEGPIVEGPIIEGPVVIGPIVEGPIGPILGGPGPVFHGPIGVGPIVRPEVVRPEVVGPGFERPRFEGIATRDTSARMMRDGAARLTAIPVGLSVFAAGPPVSIVERPVAFPPGTVITERERLDRMRTPQGTALSLFLEKAATVSVSDLRTGIDALVESGGALALAPTPARAALAVGRDEIVGRLDPNRTVVAAVRSRLELGHLVFDPFPGGLIRPIMAAPRFDVPMYKRLDSYDRDWLVPGLGDIPEPEWVTLLSSNDLFTEAFMVGLSDEMGRELLWRGYPTDSRGTYFHRFWDASQDELLSPIHRWRFGDLGTHVRGGPPGKTGRAVVVIRGEIVRRYPDLTVMALKETGGKDDEGRPFLPEKPTGLPDAAPALFYGSLPPDIMLAGLDITVDELRSDGWWIVISEHPQATRFRNRADGAVEPGPVEFANAGGRTGATNAKERLEWPTRVAFEAGDFLPEVS